MHIGGLETNSSSCLDLLAISVVCLSAHLYYSFGSSRIGRSIFSLLQCLATDRSFTPALLPLHHVRTCTCTCIYNNYYADTCHVHVHVHVHDVSVFIHRPLQLMFILCPEVYEYTMS